MSRYSYDTSGVCSRRIEFSVEDGLLHDIRFTSGCEGNLRAIGKLLEGTDAKRAADLLRGNRCGGKETSCADQLAKAIDLALARS